MAPLSKILTIKLKLSGNLKSTCKIVAKNGMTSPHLTSSAGIGRGIGVPSDTNQPRSFGTTRLTDRPLESRWGGSECGPLGRNVQGHECGHWRQGNFVGVGVCLKAAGDHRLTAQSAGPGHICFAVICCFFRFFHPACFSHFLFSSVDLLRCATCYCCCSENSLSQDTGKSLTTDKKVLRRMRLN